jgi:hypothetical protein
MSCILVAFVAVYLLFLPPPSLPLDPKTDDDATEYDYVIDDQTPSAELPRKQNPLDHSYITHSFSPMLVLDFATIIDCSYSNAYPDFVNLLLILYLLS